MQGGPNRMVVGPRLKVVLEGNSILITEEGGYSIPNTDEIPIQDRDTDAGRILAVGIKGQLFYSVEITKVPGPGHVSRLTYIVKHPPPTPAARIYAVCFE